ncbi:Flp pilus assembly protein CpaB [Pseudarthrobacter cellobiosi]|uniref:Flp pilus assembly protein CpaB n=1 Tax=Pseudarthrobacter cellobiosi TaxID=2953654 RepID=UPI00208F422B|nr:RcpC/CpaB family pilus assembly protein [Pseudarthrobacter sp. HLT1-5]MCO4256768.1 RcpC/CpaB family pilus assembly protein [Pseudarthrobacter sp. HLT1-5]
MKSRLLAGTAAAVLALIGAIVILVYAQGADERAVEGLEPVDVLVVQQAVPAGTPVDSLAAAVAVQKLPGAAVAQSALGSLDESAGKVTAVEMHPGEQLLAERLIAPEDLKSQGSVQIPKGLQEISFQLEPQRVVGGRIAPGDLVGIFISLDNGGIEAKSDKETTELAIHKVLVTAVQRAPQGAAGAAPSPSASAYPNSPDPKDTELPQGSLLLTVAVSDIDASKIVFAAEYAKLWLSKEPADAKDSGGAIMQRNEVYR